MKLRVIFKQTILIVFTKKKLTAEIISLDIAPIKKLQQNILKNFNTYIVKAQNILFIEIANFYMSAYS